jgi:hypothetical protein
MVTTNNVVILMVVVYFAWSVLCKSESISCRFASVGMSRTFTFLLCIVTYTPRKYYECTKNGELREVGVLLRTGGLSRHTCYWPESLWLICACIFIIYFFSMLLRIRINAQHHNIWLCMYQMNGVVLMGVRGGWSWAVVMCYRIVLICDINIILDIN